MGHQKMIGKDMLVAMVAKHGQYLRKVYLPAGHWVNYHTGKWVESRGEWSAAMNIWSTGKLVLPVYVRAGALLPLMAVDNQTKDAFGHRQDGRLNTDLILQVYPDATASSFTLWEDDGIRVQGYDLKTKRPRYLRRSTKLSQQMDEGGKTLTVQIAAAQGYVQVGPSRRNNDIRVMSNGLRASKVRLNEGTLAQASSLTALEQQETGWINLENGLVRIKTGVRRVSDSKNIVVDFEKK
jgi:alpha-glucosidase